MTFSVLEDLHISSSAQPDFPNLSAIQYLAFATPSFMVKKRMDIPFLIPPMEYLDSGITHAFLRSIILLAHTQQNFNYFFKK